MARFFVSQNSVQDGKITITGPDVKHITRVLRLETGESIDVSTGNGIEFVAVIREITSRAVDCEIITEKELSTEPPVKVTLYQGLPKGDKMELIIQKSTELGVDRIIPVICERTVVKLDIKKSEERQLRWQRVAEEAAKQSRRTSIPVVSKPIRFEQAVEHLSPDVLAVMPWEKQVAGGMRHILKTNWETGRQVVLFIGPEGGFSPREALLAQTNGVHLVSLGPRIMRTETAGIVAVAVVLYELGDLGGKDDG